MRIAFVLPALRVGGAEQVVRMLAKDMMARHQVLVIGAFAGGAMEKRLEADGIPFLAFHSRRRLAQPIHWIAALGTTVSELRSALATFQPHIVNAHMLGHTLEVLLAAHLAGHGKVLLTLHNTYPLFSRRGLKPWLRRWWLRLLLRRATSLIAVSGEVSDWAVSHRMIERRRIAVVRNGIEMGSPSGDRMFLRQAHGIPPDKTVFITVASLSHKKGHSVLVDAVARMPAALRERSLFLLVGEGSRRQTLEAQVRTLGVTASIRFMGLRNDVWDLLALSDVYVVSSLFEGLSLSLMEAMAAELPVVSARVAGSTVLVKHGRNGFVFDPGDATSLSNMLAYCVEHPEHVQVLGRAARADIVGGFSAARMARETERVFRSLLNGLPT